MANATSGPPLDEVQWKGDAAIMEEFGPYGIHSNTVLFYFKYSPFYDNTSNNEVLFQQGLVNRDMAQFLSTRELFEGRLNTMSGLEFRVAQEPAESGPGKGTGVWVINKQTRQKRQGQEDEITVHSTYFIVGLNVYMAPTVFDIISGRVVRISLSLSFVFLVDHLYLTDIYCQSTRRPSQPRCRQCYPSSTPFRPGHQPGAAPT